MLTAEEVARRLSISPFHVYRLARERQIPHFRIGRSVRFTEEAIGAWIARQSIAPIGEG